MTDQLFLTSDPGHDLTKTSGSEVLLADDPSMWPTEILQEFYKQVPYAADFQPDVVMDRVDGEQRFAFGHVEVSNKTSIPGPADAATAQAAGVRTVRIPIFVKEGRLQPFDVLVTPDAKILPLTERRLRSAIFRPQLHDVTSRTPGDQSMVSQLFPPYRQNYGFGGGGAVASAGMGKEGSTKEALNMSTLGSYLKTQTDPQGLARASKSLLGRGAQQVAEGGAAAAVGQKKLLAGNIAAQRATSAIKAASILSAILPTIDPADFRAFTDEAMSPTVKAAFIENQVNAESSINLLAGYQPVDASERSEKLAASIVPTVLQISRASGEYIVKTASHALWEPRVRTLDRGTLLELVGQDMALSIDKHGSATIVDGEQAPSDEPEGERATQIKDYGIYRVQSDDGTELIGACFPNLIDINGQALPLVLFTNGKQSAVQGDIAGIRVGTGAGLMDGPPSGHGVFNLPMPDGSAQATVPLTLHGSASAPGEEATILAETMEGQQVNIQIQSGIKSITPMGDVVAIPDTYRWLPLDNTEEVHLVEQADGFQKKAASIAHVLLRGDASGIFTVEGAPVEKLASYDRRFLDIDATMFLLGGLGVSPLHAIEKMGQAVQSSAPVRVGVVRDLEPASVTKQAMHKRATELLAHLPNLRRRLVKEAAAIPDPTAIDTVLSLGFINPDNLVTFISYLPELDQSQQKLCELLVAARLGLQEISVEALERAVRSLEDVIEGLNVIAFSKN